MDAELSQVAADILRPGEQLLWAGKPSERGQLRIPPSFYAVFGTLLVISLILAVIDFGADPTAIALNMAPLFIFVAVIGLVLATVARKFTRPTHNTFLLTRQRAVHVFLHGQTTNVASVPLDSRTSVDVSRIKSGCGTLTFKRKPGSHEPVPTIPLLLPKRTAWSGLRFSGVPQAVYVRDVAKWAIAQNSSTGVQEVA